MGTILYSVHHNLQFNSIHVFQPIAKWNPMPFTDVWMPVRLYKCWQSSLFFVWPSLYCFVTFVQREVTGRNCVWLTKPLVDGKVKFFYILTYILTYSPFIKSSFYNFVVMFLYPCFYHSSNRYHIICQITKFWKLSRFYFILKLSSICHLVKTIRTVKWGLCNIMGTA